MLFETIKIVEGKILNLSYHQARFNNTRHRLFDAPTTIDLGLHIHPPKSGIWRCRIVYAQNIQSVAYIPYHYKKIKTLKLCESTLSYPFKYTNREVFTQLQKEAKGYDDVIIVQDGLITDTTIANIALYKNKHWYTPKTPLLPGTIRAKLLSESFLHLADIEIHTLGTYTQVALMNAMVGFRILNHVTIQNTEGKCYDY